MIGISVMTTTLDDVCIDCSSRQGQLQQIKRGCFHWQQTVRFGRSDILRIIQILLNVTTLILNILFFPSQCSNMYKRDPMRLFIQPMLNFEQSTELDFASYFYSHLLWGQS